MSFIYKIKWLKKLEATGWLCYIQIMLKYEVYYKGAVHII